jgi:hypothetical protein
MSQQQLTLLYQTAVKLYKVRRSNANYTTAQTMVKDQKVRIKGPIRPAHWIGVVVTVIRPKQTKVLCKLDDGREVTFPASCLEVI